jgi:four helix bundle protein
MAFGHEKLDVYRAAIEYVGWAYRFCEALTGHRNAKDQLLRASQAIPLNIAEGNGKGTDGDRRRYFEIARGSALECGAVQDVLQVCGAITPEENEKAKALLDRIVAMLTKLGQRGYAVCEEPGEYRTEEIDPDTDTDPDPERSKTGNRQPPAGGDGIPSLRRNVRQRTGNERRTHFTGLYVITDVLPWVQKAPCFFATPHGRRGY